MLRLITSYAHDRFPGAEHRVGGLNIHLPALVEHEEDGTRWLLVPAIAPVIVTPQTWRRALNDGAAGVMEALQDGVVATPVHRVEEQDLGDGRLCLAYSWSAIFGDADGIPTYHEVLDQIEAKSSTEMRTSAHSDVRSGFVHLHTHSEFSPLDGLSRMDEIVREVTGHGQTSLAITDHGTCAGHPELQRAADKAGIKPIFGIEANLTDDRILRGSDISEGDPRFHDKTSRDDKPITPAQALQNHYWHLCLFAENDTGLRNIWAASTESFRDGFYGRPRMDWDTLARHSEGVIASTGCLRGPVAVALQDGDMDLARQRLTRLMDIFPGRLYVELQPNDMDKQRLVNTEMIDLAREFGLPLLATVDSHFPTAADADTHQVWIACQTQKDVQDEGDLFAEHLDLYVMGEDQVRAGLAYLGQDAVEESIANTVELAERCNARIESGTSTPSFTGDPKEDARRLHELCTANWDRLPIETHEQNQLYKDRYHREMRLLVEKDFCGYFMMVADYVGWAKDNGILVGPGRGSGGGSLVAYLARITSLDPIKHDLLFERFLTKGRAGLPDFDVDFPASKKGEILGYLRQRWGAKYVVSIGSEGRLKNKAVLDNLLRAMKSRLPENAEADLKQVKELIKEAEAGSAGLGMSWEDLWIQHGEQLQPYADRYPELFDMAEKLVGRLKSYGRHAAGVIISTDKPLTDWIPLRSVDGVEQMVSQWAMNDVEAIGLVKFDILTLGTLDVVQMCLDLIYERRQYRVDPETWDIEFEDPMVWEQLQASHTLGVFQIETHSGTRLCERMRPRNLPELADMVTLVRPGPMRSGLTDAYLRRRAGEQAVTFPDDRLRDVLGGTHGAIIYQEQVMAATRLLAGYDESEADAVRKILGKKQVEKIHIAGQEFVSRSAENGMARENAAHLWGQMAEFSRYCLAGETRVSLASANGVSDGTMSIEDMYRRLHSIVPPRKGRPKRGEEFSGPCLSCGEESRSKARQKYSRGLCANRCYPWWSKFTNPSKGLYALSQHADGRIRPARVLDVLYQGENEVVRMTLANGFAIKATTNHKVMTMDGLKPIHELQVGDSVIVDAGYEPQVYEPEKIRLTAGQRQNQGKVNGAYGDENYGYINGGHASWAEFRRTAPKYCHTCGVSDVRLEIAHIDGDRTNNDHANLALWCVSCHKKYDYANNGRQRRWEKGHPAEPAMIMSIEPLGVEKTYDLVMEDPHNFVANGIVVSNSFNKSHAYAYAMLAYWTAFLKVHYPVEFLVAAMSIVDDDKLPGFVKESRRLGVAVLPPDINASGKGFSADPDQRAVRYGLDSVKGIGEAAVGDLTVGQPYTSWPDFQERKGPKANAGVIGLLARVGAFDKLMSNRRALEAQLLAKKTGESTRCTYKQDGVVHLPDIIRMPKEDIGEFEVRQAFERTLLPPDTCTFDWSTEPVPVNKRTGKKLKPKSLPKKCTKACRQYVSRPPMDLEIITPYTDEDIRQIEFEMLGTYLTSTPFDRMKPKDREVCKANAERLRDGAGGHYIVAAILTSVRPHRLKPMGFIGAETEISTLSAAVFQDTWEAERPRLTPGQLCLLELRKTDRGLNLVTYQPL